MSWAAIYSLTSARVFLQRENLLIHILKMVNAPTKTMCLRIFRCVIAVLVLNIMVESCAGIPPTYQTGLRRRRGWLDPLCEMYRISSGLTCVVLVDVLNGFNAGSVLSGINSTTIQASLSYIQPPLFQPSEQLPEFSPRTPRAFISNRSDIKAEKWPVDQSPIPMTISWAQEQGKAYEPSCSMERHWQSNGMFSPGLVAVCSQSPTLGWKVSTYHFLRNFPLRRIQM
jgi:hypothetical protein